MIAAGTGLGEAMLLNVERPVRAGRVGRRTRGLRGARDAARNRDAPRAHPHLGRVSVEDDSLGSRPRQRLPVHARRVRHRTDAHAAAASRRRGCAPASAPVADPGGTAGRASAAAAMERRCDQCVEALDMFVSVYGAEAGNIALRAVATAGVYIGGGIAPKILPALQSGRFWTRSARRSRWTSSSRRFLSR